MTGFFGRYQTTLDDKGRFAVPAKFRTVAGPGKKTLLGDTVMLTTGLEGCLTLYPSSHWSEIQAKLSGLSFTRRDFRYFSRRFYSSATAVNLDRAGRVLVPSHLVDEAGLKKDLLVIGVDRWMEIWNPERFEYYLSQFSGSYEEVAERLFSRDEQQKE